MSGRAQRESSSGRSCVTEERATTDPRCPRSTGGNTESELPSLQSRPALRQSIRQYCALCG